MAATETEIVQGIGSDYEIKYGFQPDEEGLLLQVRPRALARARRRDLVAQERARLDAEVPPQVARLLPRAADADVGRRPERHRLREHLLLHPPDREAGDVVGGPAGRHQGHVGQARHPGGGEEVPRRRRRAVRVRGRLPQAPGGPREAGRDLPRHGLGAARARGARQAVLRDDHPAERQQVRGAQLGRLVGRLVHLRAAGRARSRCRSRPTSASTPRTWASSSAR